MRVDWQERQGRCQKGSAHKYSSEEHSKRLDKSQLGRSIELTCHPGLMSGPGGCWEACAWKL
jgi:hypothetical protein